MGPLSGIRNAQCLNNIAKNGAQFVTGSVAQSGVGVAVAV